MGDGDGAHGPKAHDVTIPCDDGPGGHALDPLVPKGPRPRDPAPPAVRDPASYAVAGKLLLATAGAFAGILLALVAMHLYNNSRRRRRGLGDDGGRPRRLLRSLAIAGGDGDDREGGAAPSPRGLDPAVLAAMPVVVVGGAAAGGDCAVCLAELERGEKARALPRCGHRFHVECIDAWFRGNATCPLCRADVVVVVAPPAAAPSAPAEGGARPEVRIDVAGDDAAADGSVAPAMAMARLPSASGTDRGKARQVFASTRFAASF